MKKHIYLHTSNLDNIPFLKEEEKFQQIFNYPKSEVEKANKNERGRLV